MQAFLAYSLWGALPIVFALYMTPNPVDLLSWRIVMAQGVTLVAVAIVKGGWRRLAKVLKNRRDHSLLILAGHLIAVNWGLYIYAVASHRVLEASLVCSLNAFMRSRMRGGDVRHHLRIHRDIAVSITLIVVIILAFCYRNLP